MNDLGMVLLAQEQFKEARQYLEGAYEIRSSDEFGSRLPDAATTLNNLGWLLYRQGDYPAALKRIEDALKIRKQVLGDAHADTIVSLDDMGTVLAALGDAEGARTRYQEALGILERHPELDPQHERATAIQERLSRLRSPG